jgi:hypothetical protein
VISWMLEVEDAEDVACTVDDMGTTDRWPSLDQRGWSEGRGYKSMRITVLVAGGARLWRPCEILRHCLFQAMIRQVSRLLYAKRRENPTVQVDHRLLYSSTIAMIIDQASGQVWV